jgi:uncharacterized membrane protein
LILHACAATAWPLTVTAALLVVMGVDYGLQWLRVLESTNTRRFLTGIAGGYGIFGIAYHVIMMGL